MQQQQQQEEVKKLNVWQTPTTLRSALSSDMQPILAAARIKSLKQQQQMWEPSLWQRAVYQCLTCLHHHCLLPFTQTVIPASHNKTKEQSCDVRRGFSPAPRAVGRLEPRREPSLLLLLMQTGRQKAGRFYADGLLQVSLFFLGVCCLTYFYHMLLMQSLL